MRLKSRLTGVVVVSVHMGQGKGPFGRGGPILVGAGISVVLARRRGKSTRFIPDPGLCGTLNLTFPYPSFPLFFLFSAGDPVVPRSTDS